MTSEPRPYTFDRVVRLVISTLGILAALWLVNTLRDVLLPFLVAWLIAYLLEPFVQYNRRLLRVRKRYLPIFVTLFETVLLLVALGVVFMPDIADEMRQTAVLFNNYASQAATIPFIPESVHDFLRSEINFREIASHLTRQDWRVIFDGAADLLSGGFSLVMVVFNWFLVLLYVVFIMLDYERLLRGFRRMVPPKHRERVFAIGSDIKQSMNHYFRGQALVAFCVGVLFSIGFTIVGLPLAIVLGMFIGLLNMVPYLQLISIVPTTLLCVVYSMDSKVEFWNIWGACIVVYIVVQCIQDLILTPRIMGKAMGLNPAIILLSISVWGTLLGFVGFIIALPLTTLLLAYYDQYITHREDGESPEEHEQDEHALRDIIENPK
ncbi:MAG: AI-2E family transporter [Muribaculaceae bacterium]|nr:AI-2E family transporter [Muribaculaceae bacterium]